MPEQQLTTGQKIQRMIEIREERRKIAQRDKELIAEYGSLESQIMNYLDEQEMEKASTSQGTATITETIVPQVVDWDAFYEWIVDTDSFHLLQKRPAAAAYRELHESGQSVPGVEPYPKRSIGLRKK